MPRPGRGSLSLAVFYYYYYYYYVRKMCRISVESPARFRPMRREIPREITRTKLLVLLLLTDPIVVLLLLTDPIVVLLTLLTITTLFKR